MHLLAEGLAGLRAIEISSPRSPSYANNIAITDIARKVKIDGSYAYVAARLFRIKDNRYFQFTKHTLTEAGYYNSPGKSIDVSINGNVLI